MNTSSKNILNGIKNNFDSLFTQFKENQNNLDFEDIGVNEIVGQCVIYPLLDVLDIYSNNKNLIPILSEIDNERILSLNIGNYGYLPESFSLKWNKSLPISRVYVNEDNVFVKHCADGNNLRFGHLTVLNEDWNFESTPATSDFSPNSNSYYIVLDIWEGEMPLTEQFKENYIKIMSSSNQVNSTPLQNWYNNL